ncbi:hypothetical protein OROHE_017118 [Orobanche hederae]
MTPSDSDRYIREPEYFHNFFESWIVEQNQHLQELVHVSKEHEEQQRHEGLNRRTRTPNDAIMRTLVERVVQHYESYYEEKSSWVKYHALSMFNPSWLSTLEDAFLWIGGWRPTMAFHLLYTKLGLQLEARLDEIIRGLMKCDLAELSPGQMERVDKLQRETLKEEKEITEELAQQQEKVADASMVELSHTVSEMVSKGADADRVVAEGRLDSVLAPKVEGMVRVLHMADDLRLKTLKKVIGILLPSQGVYFLIAAAQLHLRVHEWGTKKDAATKVEKLMEV